MNRLFVGSLVAPLLLAAAVATPVARAQRTAASADFLVARAETGRPGGQLVVVQRAEPRTLNPVTAVDGPSRDVLRRMHADLIHINRETQRAEPALAKSWTVSPDGRRYTVTLRRGIQFSDGQPFDADDVVFSFRVYLDEEVASAYRDLLTVGGKPIAVRKLDQQTVQFDLSEPYAVGRAALRQRRDAAAASAREAVPRRAGWPRRGACGTGAAEFAGLGPFRFKQHVPGERIVLERNPFYWKSRPRGHSPAVSRHARVRDRSERRRAGGAVSVGRSGRHDAVERGEFRRAAAGSAEAELRAGRPRAGLDYTFLVFNLNDLTGKGAGRRRSAGRRGFDSWRFDGPSRSRSIARASFASSIAGGPRRCGATSRPATSCG